MYIYNHTEYEAERRILSPGHTYSYTYKYIYSNMNTYTHDKIWSLRGITHEAESI